MYNSLSIKYYKYIFYPIINNIIILNKISINFNKLLYYNLNYNLKLINNINFNFYWNNINDIHFDISTNIIIIKDIFKQFFTLNINYIHNDIHLNDISFNCIYKRTIWDNEYNDLLNLNIFIQKNFVNLQNNMPFIYGIGLFFNCSFTF